MLWKGKLWKNVQLFPSRLYKNNQIETVPFINSSQKGPLDHHTHWLFTSQIKQQNLPNGRPYNKRFWKKNKPSAFQMCRIDASGGHPMHLFSFVFPSSLLKSAPRPLPEPLRGVGGYRPAHGGNGLHYPAVRTGGQTRTTCLWVYVSHNWDAGLLSLYLDKVKTCRYLWVYLFVSKLCNFIFNVTHTQTHTLDSCDLSLISD